MVDIIQRNRQFKDLVERCEDFADTALRKTRKYLPHIARFCLIATFIEDGFRLITQFTDQIDYISVIWNMPSVLSFIFIVINVFTQFVGSFCVLSRIRTNQGCFLLMFTVLIQTIGYHIFTRIFFTRNLSLCGSLLLLLTESTQENKSTLAGLPNTGQNNQKTYLLLGGRILVILMFVTLVDYSGGYFYLILSAACLVLIVMVAIGYKTKLCSLILIVLLSGINLTYNAFWTARTDSMWDYLKYDFFQTLSVIGGLLLIVAYGPGGVSVDDFKKQW